MTSTPAERRHRVLVVDDSAFARKVLREVLAKDERLEVVGFARDGLDALEKIAELKPDVITLDLVMPELDGVGVLQALKEQENQSGGVGGASGPRSPRVVVVTMSDADSALGVAALDAGAFDVVHKPTALATDRLYDLEKELVQKVIAAATSRQRRARATAVAVAVAAPVALPAKIAALPASKLRTRLVVIGASTGGPRALTEILNALPADFPVPIAAVVHMPLGYTRAFAERMNVSSLLHVREATDGLVLQKGVVVIARAGGHMRVRGAPNSETGVLAVAIEDAAEPEQPESESPGRIGGSPHRPSVDVLFASAAKAAGANLLGVVLTGMGSDGLEGARAIHRAGGRLLTESESSCVVYGMPRSVAEANLGAESAPLELMVQAILDNL